MLAVVQSGALVGIEAVAVAVEVNSLAYGEGNKLGVIGLPDQAVKEGADRVYSALANSGFRVPQSRVTVNLAPGDLRKEGALFDLPIALGLIAALRQARLDERLPRYLIAGELGLTGETRPVRGALALARLARTLAVDGLVLPSANAPEAALVSGVNVIPVASLSETVQFLDGRKEIAPAPSQIDRWRDAPLAEYAADFHEVKGQHAVRRAVEVAVAGGHNLLILGPPGSGKSMVAKRIPTILPEPTIDEFLEILSIHSAAGRTVSGDLAGFRRPFRSPHHTISDAGLLGGGAIPGPGEISLAHHGVLFLDELPEFKRSALEVMRQPLEDGEVTIARAAGHLTLPSAFMLVAAMNPCPCGYLGDAKGRCQCGEREVTRYRARLSGPLLDRIDIHVEAPALSLDEIRDERPAESSAAIRQRVLAARQRQTARFGPGPVACNARMTPGHLRNHCPLSPALGQLLAQAMERLQLSARAYTRVLKVARTIADLAASDTIQAPHLLEAIQYRSLDRARQ